MRCVDKVDTILTGASTGPLFSSTPLSRNRLLPSSISFFLNDTATTEIYTLSLHDALPISFGVEGGDHSPRDKGVFVAAADFVFIALLAEDPGAGVGQIPRGAADLQTEAVFLVLGPVGDFIDGGTLDGGGPVGAGGPFQTHDRVETAELDVSQIKAGVGY